MTATIGSIKDLLGDLIGENVVITVDAGRRKTKVHEGILTETYPAVFVVELDDCEGSYERVSYSYTDVLTQSIDVEFPEADIELPLEEA